LYGTRFGVEWRTEFSSAVHRTFVVSFLAPPSGLEPHF
jgi:hypothetical protein